MRNRARRLPLVLLVGACLLAVGIPALAASPEPSGDASAAPSAESSVAPSSEASVVPSSESSTAPSSAPAPSTAPESSAQPDLPGKAQDDAGVPDTKGNGKDKDHKDKEPETPVTVSGTIVATTDADGRTTYSVSSGGKTWTLSAGPSWFWGAKNPLQAFVGKSVSVAGSVEGAGTEIDVETVDGTAIRAPGKPPWAGGPWVVGKSHPGWKDWMSGGKPGKGHGRDDAPGQVKKESETP